MNSPPDPEQLIQSYRTTFIGLARHYVRMLDESANLRIKAEIAINGGVKSGLYCQARTNRQNAARLRDILDTDIELIALLFGTKNIYKIAELPIKVVG